jgi:hypothetical protein
MKTKAIITIVLLLFVAASVVYLAVGEIGKDPAVAGKPADPITIAPSTADPSTTDPVTVDPVADSPSIGDPVSPPTTPSAETYVNVYYFHGYYRCITCRNIEMYTREAVNGAFLNELGNGSLHIQILNMQDPVNEAYVNDFKLEYYVVVLEKVVDGKRVEWKKLEGVWDLLDDKDAFKKYVISETRNYLGGVN